MDNLYETAASIITESVENLFLSDVDKRKKYADDVWNILSKSYAPVGGLKGGGFNSKEEMIAKIPFWKILKKSGKVVAVIMYKDKNGRKSVALGTTPEGKNELAREFVNDLKRNRALMELSKAALSFMVKLVGYDEIIKYAKTPEEAQRLLLDDEIEEAPKDDPDYTKHRPLQPYMYLRTLGDKYKSVKIMIGTSGNEIIDKTTV